MQSERTFYIYLTYFPQIVTHFRNPFAQAACLPTDLSLKTLLITYNFTCMKNYFYSYYYVLNGNGIL